MHLHVSQPVTARRRRRSSTRRTKNKADVIRFLEAAARRGIEVEESREVGEQRSVEAHHSAVRSKWNYPCNPSSDTELNMTSAWLLVTTVLVLYSRLASSFTPPTNGNSHHATAASTHLGVAASTQYDIVNVDLTDGRDYPIYIGSDFTDAEASALLRKHVHGKRVLLITNDRIAPMYLEKYQGLLGGEGLQGDTVVLPDGEENKSFDVMSMILGRALELGLDRRSTFVALGGGVIGDMVGFASAIYQRGVNFIQVRLDLIQYSSLLSGGC